MLHIIISTKMEKFKLEKKILRLIQIKDYTYTYYKDRIIFAIMQIL